MTQHSDSQSPERPMISQTKTPQRLLSGPLRLYLLRPRWSKVLGDIWQNKLRAILVILSIALGTFAVGTIAEARIRMLEGLDNAYRATSPVHGIIVVSPDSVFDDDLVEAVRRLPGVAEAQGRTLANVRLNLGPNEWANLQLLAVRDWNDIRIGKLQVEAGPVPPGDREMLIERSALSEMLGVDIAIGDDLRVETLDQKQRTLKLVGSVYDLSVPPPFLFGNYSGYITLDTLEWLGEPRDYTQLVFQIDEALLDNRDAVTAVGRAVRDQIERSDREVVALFIPPNPGRSPLATFILDPLVFLLGALGVLMGFLSGFLVMNTVSGLLTQQTRQIGILKAIGARSGQIVGIYLVLVTLFGIAAFAVAVPLAHLAAARFAVFFGQFFNFDPATTGLLPEVLAAQLFLSLGVPLVAALIPILRGSGVTVREAISGDGGMSRYGTGRIDRILQVVRGLPRPLILSVRNTFRRKGRLALTLITLTLASAIFISVSSVQASIDQSLANLFDTLISYDIEVSFDRPYRIQQVEQVALSVPGVAQAESIGSVLTRRQRPDEGESDSISLQGIRLESALVEPRIVDGRWLLPGDENAIVVSANLLSNEGDVAVGDDIILTINQRESTWRIVGVFQSLGNQQSAYANYDYFAREVREVGQARRMQIITSDPGNSDLQAQVAQQLEAQFRSLGIRVEDTSTATALRELDERQFNIITLLLTIMALLIALVGGLGLAGTMSINVLERTREIGVMRSIGASNWAVLRLILTESVLIGLLSWAIGGILAVPLSQFLSEQVGVLFTGAPLFYVFSVNGVLVWLGSSAVLAVIASWLPAWNATRLTVREVLAYE